MDIKTFTIKSVQDGLKQGHFSIMELQKEFHSLIKRENKELNSYLSFFEPEHAEPPKGILFGVPIAIKDNILIEGVKATAASKILENYIAPYSATVIDRLKNSGVIFLGKTNLDEFAMGASTENSAFGVTKNPYDKTRVAGGSSGGSAAAVASGLAVCGLGSDTGGSIRQPASFCGVVGLKPSYGRVSRHGLMAMASSLDQIGPITKNVYDAALLMNVIAGHDPMDSTTSPKAVPDYTSYLQTKLHNLKIGIPKEFFSKGLDPQVGNLMEKSINQFKLLNAEIKEVSLPHVEYAVPIYYVLVSSEVSSNLARYDGIKYGLSKNADNLLDVYRKSRAEGLGKEVQRRIMLGTFALSSGYFDAYYMKAQKVRALIKKDFENIFNEVDVIIGPTTPTPAFKIGEKSDDPLAMYLADIYTAVVNLAGLPAISVPCGRIDGLPVGLQIIGRAFEEETVLRTAYAFEQSLA